MENASEALKIAASVLIFVLALSITINAFGETRRVSQILVSYKDREYDTTYVEDNGTTARKVGIETVIPTISRAFNENIRIVFKSTNENQVLFTKKDSLGVETKINFIDLKELNLSKEETYEFIMSVIYGNEYEKFNNVKESFIKNKRIYLNDNGIYGKIKGRTLKEEIGIFYVEELPKEGSSPSGENIPDINKTLKRVITYTFD